jgi:hypothetical protein
MRLTNAGFLGVLNTNPQYELDVLGIIRGDTLKVASNTREMKFEYPVSNQHRILFGATNPTYANSVASMSQTNTGTTTGRLFIDWLNNNNTSGGTLFFRNFFTNLGNVGFNVKELTLCKYRFKDEFGNGVESSLLPLVPPLPVCVLKG